MASLWWGPFCGGALSSAYSVEESGLTDPQGEVDAQTVALPTGDTKSHGWGAVSGSLAHQQPASVEAGGLLPSQGSPGNRNQHGDQIFGTQFWTSDILNLLV